MPRPVHFEINCDDPERAAKFFTDVFGWEIKKWEGPVEYWLVMTGDPKIPGIDGGLMKREAPGAAVYNTIDVPSVDEYVKKIAAAGGTIAVPKMAIPGVGWFAYFKDTEGNIHGIMENDPKAK